MFGALTVVGGLVVSLWYLLKVRPLDRRRRGRATSERGGLAVEVARAGGGP